jgi:hypothetical protein
MVMVEEVRVFPDLPADIEHHTDWTHVEVGADQYLEGFVTVALCDGDHDQPFGARGLEFDLTPSDARAVAAALLAEADKAEAAAGN